MLGDGVPIQCGVVPAVVFADDMYVVVQCNHTRLSERVDDVTTPLQHEGLGLVHHTCSWLTTVQSPQEVLMAIGCYLRHLSTLQPLGSRVAETQVADFLPDWDAYHLYWKMMTKIYSKFSRWWLHRQSCGAWQFHPR